eukprot:826952-Alexandrium_andersonii.AAC.1
MHLLALLMASVPEHARARTRTRKRARAQTCLPPVQAHPIAEAIASSIPPHPPGHMSSAEEPPSLLDIGAPRSNWRSVNGRRAPGWAEQDAFDLAAQWMDALPSAALDLCRSAQFQGGCLVSLKDVESTPTRKDVEANFVWLLGVVKKYSDRIPSGYLIADGLIALDSKLGGDHLKTPPGQLAKSKALIAMGEAAKLKRLLGHLRFLFRASGRSPSPKIQQLKQHLRSRKGMAQQEEENTQPPYPFDDTQDAEAIEDEVESLVGDEAQDPLVS